MALWWKFQLPGLGVHHLRAKNLGAAGQEVYLDGTPLEAPQGTTTFTGPGACLLELQHRGGDQWVLLVDGAEVPPQAEGAVSAGPVHAAAIPGGAPLWWKLSIAGAGTHLLRVSGIGSDQQQLVLDGAPIDAPPGTLTFTGPAGSLLELRPSPDGTWMLLADGSPVPQYDPNAEAESPILWSFVLPTGTHFLEAVNLGKRGQQISLDGVAIAAPEGELAFTGPGGALLQLQPSGGSWNLFVDGAPIEAANAVSDTCRSGDGMYVFSYQGRTHQLQAVDMGGGGQQVFLDGEVVSAPPGTTCFTGPGGCLLELKPERLGWALYLDGACVAVGEADPLPARPTTPAVVEPAVRAAIAPTAAESLPQGVSLDSSTGKYTANIRVGGKFRFLGEFSTSQEASERYQQAKKGMA